MLHSFFTFSSPVESLSHKAHNFQALMATKLGNIYQTYIIQVSRILLSVATIFSQKTTFMKHRTE